MGSNRVCGKRERTGSRPGPANKGRGPIPKKAASALSSGGKVEDRGWVLGGANITIEIVATWTVQWTLS